MSKHLKTLAIRNRQSHQSWHRMLSSAVPFLSPSGSLPRFLPSPLIVPSTAAPACQLPRQTSPSLDARVAPAPQLRHWLMIRQRISTMVVATLHHRTPRLRLLRSARCPGMFGQDTVLLIWHHPRARIQCMQTDASVIT